MKLNKDTKRSIAIASLRATVTPILLHLHKQCSIGITALAREQFADFDFKGAAKFPDYIKLTSTVLIDFHNKVFNNDENVHRLDIRPYNDMLKILQVFPTSSFTLEDNYQIPARSGCNNIYLDAKYLKRAITLIKPYAYKFNEAVEMFNEMITALDSISTVKMLEENLPSLVPFLTLSEKGTTALIPLQQFQKINKFVTTHDHIVRTGEDVSE